MKGFAHIDFDAVAPLHPSDKVAGRVAARGEHFEWSPAPHHTHSADPIAVRRPSEGELKQASFVDLTGVKVARLTVIGIAAEIVSGNGTNWVVRCVCGSYETRKAKFIKACAAGNNPGEDEPMCDWCNKTRKLQRGIHHPKKAAAAAEAIQNCNR